MSDDNDIQPAKGIGPSAEGQEAAPDYSVEPVPKVPHKIGWRWALSDIIRIIFLGGLLSMIVVAREPCSNSVATFVDSFEEPDAAPAAAPEMKLERLTEEEIQRRFGKNDLDAGGATDASPAETP